MVDLNKLDRPKRPAKAAKETKVQKPEEVRVEEPTIPAALNNLQKPTRGTKIAKQFRLDPDLVRDFETTARERGYRQRQDSAFFVEVWNFFKENINKV